MKLPNTQGHHLHALHRRLLRSYILRFVLAGLGTFLILLLLGAILSDQCGCGYRRSLFRLLYGHRVLGFTLGHLAAITIDALFLAAAALSPLPRVLKFSLISLAGIGIAALLLATLNQGHKNCPDSQRIADLRNLRIALELYRDANERFPDTLDALAPVFIPALPSQQEEIINNYQLSTNPNHATLRVRLDCRPDPPLRDDLNPDDAVYELGL